MGRANVDPTSQRVIAMVNNKGGVGKTTCALNIAAGLAPKDRRVLIVDTDPQANASLVLLGAKLFELPYSIYDVLLESDRHIREIIIPTPIAGLDLAPFQTSLANAELNLAPVRGRERVLRRSMARGLEDYQYILIDCPPSLGLLTFNALLAAGEVHIPPGDRGPHPRAVDDRGGAHAGGVGGTRPAADHALRRDAAGGFLHARPRSPPHP